MTETPVQRFLNALYRATGKKAKPSGKGWQARCPAHDDRCPSLSIAEGAGGRVLVTCHAGCTPEAIVAAVGLALADLMPEGSVDVDRNGPGPEKRAIVSTLAPPDAKNRRFPTARAAIAELEKRHGKPSAMWTYHNAKREPVGVICRWDRPNGTKDIRPVALNGEGWVIGGVPEPRPLYRLPELATAKRVFVVEGEKCVEAARSIGLTATTSAGGAKAAAKTDWSPLAGKEVVILPDHDEAGRSYDDAVVALLVKVTPVPVVKVVELPGLPEGGDIHDWLEQRDAHDPEELHRQVEALVDGAVPIDSKTLGQTRGPILVRLADVQPEPIRWLWPGRIPLGKVTLLAGDPGLGKSLLTLDWAARVSTGRSWPDYPECAGPIGGVVLLSAEDDLADTIRPRLDAAGADVSRIVALTAVRGQDSEGSYSRAVDLSRDLDQIDAAIEQVADCRLVVIDPFPAYLGRTDSHKNAEIRGLLAPLAELAGRRGVAVVAVNHLRKSGGPAIYRSMGSVAFAAAARGVWVVAKDKQDPRRRLLLPAQNTRAGDILGLAFAVALEGEGSTPVIAWEPDAVSMSADDALAEERGQDDHGDAGDWLREALADGEMAAADVLKEGRSNGYSEKAIRKAFKAIRADRRREGFGAGGTWYWFLPVSIDAPADLIDVIDAQSQKQGNNGNNGQQCSEVGSSCPIHAIDGIDAQCGEVGNNANNGQEWGEI